MNVSPMHKLLSIHRSPKQAVSDSREMLCGDRLRILFLLLVSSIFIAGTIAWGAAPQTDSDAIPPEEENTNTLITNTETDTEEAVRFRYWMVPAEKIDEWPWGPEKYYPVPGNDFKRWMEKFHQQEEGKTGDESTSPLTELALSARYEDGTFVDGQADAQFTVDEEAIPFLFDPCSLSAADFIWDNGDRASVGLYPDGNIYLAHPKTGTLHFHWSQSGTKDEDGNFYFDMAFMESPAVSLTLDLPKGIYPSLSTGEVRLLDDKQENINRWVVCPGVHSPVRLTLLSANTASQIQDKAGYQQKITSRLAEEGIDMSSRFIFDRRDIPGGEVTVILDQPLLPTSVEWVHPAVKIEKFSRISSFGTTKLQIRLPENVPDEELELNINAFCPYKEGNHCRLPGIRLLSDDLFWKETVLRLVVVRPLTATGFETFESAWTFDRFAENTPGEKVFTFKYFEPNAGVAILLSKEKPEVIFDSAHEITFEPQEIRGHSRLTLTTGFSGVVTHSFLLMPNWEMETVQEPGGGTLNWSVIQEGDSRRLEVSFQHPIPTDKPLILECTGRYLGEINSKMAVDSLIPLDLSYEPKGTHRAVFSTIPPYQTGWADEEGRAAGPFPADESALRELFGKLPAEPSIPIGNESSGIYVQLEKTSPTYSGNLRGTITLQNETLTEEWHLACTPPAGGRIDRVLAAFYDAGGPSPAEGEWTWSIIGETDHSFQVNRLSEEERRGLGLSIRSRVWEIRPQTSRSTPFEILAVRTRPIRGEEKIPLAQLPESEHQSAEIAVTSINPIPPVLDVSGVRNATALLPKTGEYESILGVFRYTASELETLHNEPKIQITNRSKGEVRGTASAWCWFLQLDSLFEPEGIVRNYLSAYIENAGRTELTITLPEPLNVDSIHAVWADSQRVTWYPETIGKQSAIRVLLPEKRRFITFALEYYYNRTPLTVRQLLSPKMPKLDIDIFSGNWNAWIPPEYAACTILDDAHRYHPLWNNFPKQYSDSDDRPFYRRFGTLWPFGKKRDLDYYRKSATAFLERLGDQAVLEKLQSQKQLALSQTAAAGNPDTEKLTWGDLFTGPEILAELFPVSDEEGTMQIYVNRLELARCSILPNTPLLLPEGATPISRSLALLEQNGIVLLMLRPDLVYVTSMQERMNFEENLIPLGSDRINTTPNQDKGDEILHRLNLTNTSEIVSGTDWIQGTAAVSNPWRFDAYLSSFPLIASGWNHYTVPLEESQRGIEAINRYQLAVRKWIFFLIVVTLTWRGPLSRFPFLIGLLGCSIAVFGFLSPASSAVCCGLGLGAAASLIFRLIRYRKPPKVLPAVVSEDSEDSEDIDESEPGFVPKDQIPHDSILLPVPELNPQKESNIAAPRDLKAEAAEIFALDLREDKQPNETLDHPLLQKLTEEITDEVTVLSPEKPDTNQVPLPSTETDMNQKEFGKTGTSLLGVLAAVGMAVLLMVHSAGAAIETANSTASGSEETVQEQRPDTDEEKYQEPARVFVPYDEHQQPKWDDYIWIPESFHQKLADLFGPQETLDNPWRLTQAFYEGTVNYNAFTQTLSLFHLKAVYTVVLETDHAMIRLPMMALPPDSGAKFDRQPIYPIFRQNELYFEITHSTPGEHTLELTLTPPLFEPGSESSVQIDIPRIPDARLELRLPPDAPPIRINGGRGTVRLGRDLLTAQLGPTDKIRLEREEEPGKIGSARVEVEQLFLLRARPNQTSLSARYRFRIADGKVQTLYFRNDPRYFLAQCSCDDPALAPTIQRDPHQNEIRILFKKPVSGIVTLRADYVVRDFSGIGQIRLPRMKASRAKITRSWLALLESPTVEFVKLFPSDVAVGTFQNIWEGEETPLAVYDLTKPDPSWTASIRLAPPQQSVRESQTIFFDTAWTRLDYAADFRTDGETFRLAFEVSDFFELDSAAITDERGNQIAAPEPHQESGHLYLFFPTPLSGEYSIRISGRTRTEIGTEKPFPSISMENGTKQSNKAEAFRSPRVLVRFKENAGWNTEPIPGNNGEIDGKTALFVGSRQTSSETESLPSRIVVERNLTKIGGEIRTVLFNRSNDRWELLSDFLLTVENGAVDRFEVDLDELCTGPVTVEPNLPIQQTDRPRGTRLTITPTQPVEGTFAFRVRTPVQSSADMLRLPKVGLAPPFGEESQIVTHIFLPAIDPVRQTRYRWDTDNLQLLADPTRRGNLDANLENRNSPAVTALAAVAVGKNQPLLEETFPAVVTQLSGMTRDDFYTYEVTEHSYRALFSAGRNVPQIFGTQSNFFIRRDGSIYAETIMDVRFFGNSATNLLLSPQAVPQQITLDGLAVPFEMTTPGQWHLELNPETAGRRLHILFYIPSEEKNLRKMPHKGNYTRLELIPAALEGIKSQQHYWTAVFESDIYSGETSAPCRIVPIESDSAAEPLPPVILPPADPYAYLPESSPWKIPVSYSGAKPILARITLEKMKNLLDTLEWASAEWSSDSSDAQRWFDRWYTQWLQYRNEIQVSLASGTPMPFTNNQKSALSLYFNSDTEKEHSDREKNHSGDQRQNRLLMKSAVEQDYLELTARLDQILTGAGLPIPVDSLQENEQTSPSAPSIWMLNHSGAESRFLIGMADSDLEKIILFRFNSVRHHLLQKGLAAFLWLAGTVILLYSLRNEAFRQKVLHWLDLAGLFAGVVWVLLKPGPMGWILIAFALIYRVIRIRQNLKKEAASPPETAPDQSEELSETSPVPPSGGTE